MLGAESCGSNDGSVPEESEIEGTVSSFEASDAGAGTSDSGDCVAVATTSGGGVDRKFAVISLSPLNSYP